MTAELSYGQSTFLHTLTGDSGGPEAQPFGHQIVKATAGKPAMVQPLRR